MTDIHEQDPLFSQRAAAALNSGYWWHGRPADDAGYNAWFKAMWEKRLGFEKAVQTARRYEDLPGEQRATFDAVEAFDRGRRGA